MINESENKDDMAVTGLLGSLPHVEAPNDFNFRVKARIAAGQPARLSWFPNAVRVAVPLGLALSVGGYFGYRAMYQDVAPQTPTVAAARTEVPLVASESPEILASNATVGPVTAGPNDKMTVKPSTGDEKMVAGSKTGTDVGIDPLTNERRKNVGPRGGSFDIGQGESKRVYPRGVDPRRRLLVKPREFEHPGSISVKDLITQLGVEAVYSESGWRVMSVTSDSIAEKAGLKSGDVVEAINDHPLNEKTSFKGQFSGKSMRLKRDGAAIVVDLKKP